MKKYSVADRIKITKTILKARDCTNSTDFCFIAFDIYELLYPAYAKAVEPVIRVEAYNREKDWVKNCVFSENIIHSLPKESLPAIAQGYKTVIDFLLMDEGCCQVYPMDGIDEHGWKIWNELDKKYAYTLGQIKTKSYVNN